MVWNEELEREIPEGWKVNNIYAIANYYNGIPCQKYPVINKSNKLPVAKIKEMHEGITKETEYVSNDIPAKARIDTGDLLFSWSASLEVQYWLSGPAALNQHIFRVIPKSGFSSEYVYQQLSTYLINFSAMADARKTTMGHITSNHMKQSRICIAPVDLISKFTDAVNPIRKVIFLLSNENHQLSSFRDFLLPLLMNGQATIKD